jgi:hypothetical protein
VPPPRSPRTRLGRWHGRGLLVVALLVAVVAPVLGTGTDGHGAAPAEAADGNRPANRTGERVDAEVE